MEAGANVSVLARSSGSPARAFTNGVTGIALAAVNAPGLCVLSGPEEQIDSLKRRLEEEGTGTIRLHASHAFHSSMMDPMLAEFERVVAGVPRKEPKLPYLSNLTGTWIEKSQPSDQLTGRDTCVRRCGSQPA